MSPRALSIKPGELLPGTKYLVKRLIAAGGMGVVYEVIKPPAIAGVLKVMGLGLADHDLFRTRFFDEVRILAQLDHPNIVRVFDYDTLADGTPYFVMELLQGQTLSEVISSVGRVPSRAAFEVTRQLCDALHCAHTHDVPVIHRDIKPDNIFLHRPKHGPPVVKLIDFGVSAVADRREERWFTGTLLYAAPEQMQGRRSTPATDIFAVGCVLYEMLSGVGPASDVVHGEADAAKVLAYFRHVPRRLSERAPWVPASIVALVHSALDKDPRRRPPSAQAFADQLGELEWGPDGVEEDPFKTPRAARAQGPALRVLTAEYGKPLPPGASERVSSRAPPPARAETTIGLAPSPVQHGSTAADTLSSQHSDAHGLPLGPSARGAAVIVAAVVGIGAVVVGLGLFASRARSPGGEPPLMARPQSPDSVAATTPGAPRTAPEVDAAPGAAGSASPTANHPSIASTPSTPSAPSGRAPSGRSLRPPSSRAAAPLDTATPTWSTSASSTPAPRPPAPPPPTIPFAPADDLIRTGP